MSNTPSPVSAGARASGSRIAVLLAGLLAMSMVSGVLLAGLFLPAVGATGSFTRDGLALFNSMPDTLENLPLPEGSTLYASDGKTKIATFYEENRVVTTLDKISPWMRQAIVAIEDARFYEHGGVDTKGLLRAFVSNELNDGQVQGASTLTQQYVKNMLLENALAEGDQQAAKAATIKTNARKIKEIRMAIQLEKTMPKDAILEGYLNISNFGQNNYGVEAAAQYFFQTTAAKLTLPQAALLAGIVQTPEAYNPFFHPQAAKERRSMVLTRMEELGMITETERAAADKTPLPTKARVAKSGCINAGAAAYFCDYVKKALLTDPRYAVLGEDEKARLNALQRGGYHIVTTMDATLVKAATATMQKKVPAKDSSRVIASAVTMEPGTGRVLSIAQNTIYNPEKGPGQTEINYGVDKAYGGSLGFQVGSNFKPFTLATWLSKNKGLYTNVNGDLNVRPFSDFTACGQRLSGQTYKFGNSEGSGQPSIDVMSATYRSVNTAFVDIESRLDMCDIAKIAGKLGVHLASVPFDTSCFRAGVSHTSVPTQCPSLTLGVFNISPMTMANAYSVFASEGTYCEPTAVDAITDRSGTKQQIGATTCDAEALPTNVARGVTFALKNVFTRGTASGTVGRTPWPAGGKTGTTDASIHTWFTGYTKQRATSVVVTDPTVYDRGTLNSPGQKSLNGRKIGGRYYGRVYGSTIAAPLWRQIMGVAMEGLPHENWPAPTGKVLSGSGIPVANVVGRSIGEATGILRGQGFKVRVSSKTVAATFGSDRVAKTSPGAGGRLERGSTVTLYPGDGSQAPPPPPTNNNGGGNTVPPLPPNPRNNNGNNGNGGGNNGNG